MIHSHMTAENKNESSFLQEARGGRGGGSKKVCLGQYSGIFSPGYEVRHNYYTPLPINPASNKQATTTLHGCILPIAPVLAPVWGPNFGGGLPQWCPALSPVSGPEPRRGGSPRPRNRREAPLRQNGAEAGPNGQERPRMVPDRVRGGSTWFHYAGLPIGRIRHTVGAPQHPATHLFSPVWACFGPFQPRP